MNIQTHLFGVLPKSVEQLSKQLHSKIVDPIILQKLIDRMYSLQLPYIS